MTATASIVDGAFGAPAADHRIAVAAHEIRTPLGGILALADLLLAEDLSEAARGHASALKTAAEHLFGVATSLLGPAGAPPRKEELDVDGFIARLTPGLRARASAKALEFRAVRGPGVPGRVLADEGVLRQIVENLADNALRATERGSIEFAVERGGGADGAAVELRFVVRDTGVGLGAAPDRLFAPFVQGDASRGAAGLGLALVAELAARMGGRAVAANRPAGGAEVGVVVRLEALGAPPSRPMRVLVAEDNPINRRVIATLLEHFGLAFDVVDDGEAAVAAVAAGGYDLVLMDATMPRLDGLEAARAIRGLASPLRDIRIVGVTARAFDHEIAAFRAAGADAVVTKPLSVAELWRVIGAPAEAARAAG